MADETHRSRLGRGLAALIGDAGAEPAVERGGRAQRRVPIAFLKPNPRNPRRMFSETELDELATSIRERGIIQPIVVRTARGSADSFEIIAGERRWRAAQRADLNPLEEAMGYQALADQYRYSQDEIAKTVGKSRSHVANTLRLLKLPASIKQYIDAGKLTAGHARALIGLPEAKAEAMARDIVERGLNVRDVESLSQQHGPGAAAKKSGSSAAKNVNTVALEKRLSDSLGLKVTIDHRGDSGVVHIKYRGLDQLDDVVDRLERK